MESLTPATIKAIFKEAIAEYENEKLQNKTYSINAVRKRLGCAHETLSKRVRDGTIKTTKDGRITEIEINRYLSNSK